MQLHHAATVPGFDGSYALVSAQSSTTTAIIFVHGFWGDSYSTWQDFQVLVDEYADRFPPFASADLFFFEYSAARNFVGPSADTLREFVNLIFPIPPECLFSEDISDTDWGPAFSLKKLFIRRGPYKYERVVFVGHSLGAVIIRHLILDAVTKSVSGSALGDEKVVPAEDPLLMADVCLMSPAHFGFRPGGTLAAAFSLTPKAGLLRSLLSCYRAFVELDPGSAILTAIRLRTEQLAKEYSSLQALRARILWAQYEDVVVMERYNCDPPADYAHERNHVSVCKPVRNYLKPLEVVSASLAQRSMPVRAQT